MVTAPATPPPHALDHRVGEFAAGEELRRLAADGHQVRFRQNLQHLVLLQGFDGGAQVDVRPEEEDIQQVGDVELGKALNQAALTGFGCSATAAQTAGSKRCR